MAVLGKLAVFSAGRPDDGRTRGIGETGKNRQDRKGTGCDRREVFILT
jgi:hypothetical protein